MGTVKGFIFDYSKCVGYHACLVACSVENSTDSKLSWRTVSHFNKPKLPLLGYVHLSLACNHCQEAPCINACPSSAYKIDPETKAVIHTPELCLGCKYCTWACPFNAPKYNYSSGIVEKCHFCHHRLKEGQIPACALNCPTGALSFGEIEEISNPQAFGFTERDIYPRIKVIGEKVKDSVPEFDPSVISSYIDGTRKDLSEENKKEWIKEWPLALFTFLSALLVGWFWAGLGKLGIPLSPWIFFATGGLAMTISTLHLGKPLRAYLSLSNLKTSWLSREILMFGLFIGFGFIAKVLDSPILQIVAMGLGVLLLLSIEMLYVSVGRGVRDLFSSGNTFAIAIVFASLFAQQMTFLVALLAFQSMLYIVRMGHSTYNPSASLALVSFVRLAIGFIVPFGLITLKSKEFTWMLLSSVILGELIDRLMFYYSFKPERPFDNVNMDSLRKFSSSN